MDIVEPIKKWLFTVALKKAIVKLAQLIVAWAIAKGIFVSFTIYGIKIDFANVEVMTAALLSISEIVRNYLKVKFPKYFSWL